MVTKSVAIMKESNYKYQLLLMVSLQNYIYYLFITLVIDIHLIIEKVKLNFTAYVLEPLSLALYTLSAVSSYI